MAQASSDSLIFDGRAYDIDMRGTGIVTAANDFTFNTQGYNDMGSVAIVGFEFNELVDNLPPTGANITVPINAFTSPVAEEASLLFVEYVLNMSGSQLKYWTADAESSIKGHVDIDYVVNTVILDDVIELKYSARVKKPLLVMVDDPDGANTTVFNDNVKRTMRIRGKVRYFDPLV